MGERQPDGATLRQHLEAAWRQRGWRREAMPERLRLPPIPAALDHIWEWFCELSAARDGNGGGPNPIGYQAVEAWARLTGRAPEPRDVRGIMDLDQAWFVLLAEQDRRREAARRAAGGR